MDESFPSSCWLTDITLNTPPIVSIPFHCRPFSQFAIVFYFSIWIECLSFLIICYWYVHIVILDNFDRNLLINISRCLSLLRVIVCCFLSLRSLHPASHTILLECSTAVSLPFHTLPWLFNIFIWGESSGIFLSIKFCSESQLSPCDKFIHYFLVIFIWAHSLQESLPFFQGNFFIIFQY